MDSFVETAAVVLPILGCDLFRRRSLSSGTRQPLAHAADGTAYSGAQLFSFATAGANATAHEIEEGFVVIAGSTARKAASSTFPAGYGALRDKLIAGGDLVEGPSPDLLRFAKDVTFSSPSAAASIVSARSASGPLEWKIQPAGTSYRDWRTFRFEQTA